MITNFNKYTKMNESINLSKEEKDFLWKKIEYKKKKKATEDENELYQLLKGDEENLSSEDFNLILKSLEYTFRKKLSGQDKPMKLDIFKKIQEKIPKDWIGISYSSLDARKKKLEREGKNKNEKDND